MIINGVQIEDPDINDAVFLELYESELDEVKRKCNEIYSKTDKRQSQQVRSVCETIFEFFDNVFGSGTAKNIFGESVNLKICISVFDECVTGMKALDKESAEFFKRMSAKYTPGKNPKKKNRNHYKKKLSVPDKR